MTAPGRMVQMTTVRMWRLFWKRDWSLRFKGIRTLHFRIGKEHIVLMINADSILAGDHLYLYGGRVNGSGEVENAEAVLKAAEIAGEKGLNIQLPPEGNPDYPYPTGGSRSDHAPFGNAGIPYIYFAANNWESGMPVETERHGVIMHTDRDDLDFIEAEYGDRAKNTLASYSSLLYSLVREGEWK